MKCGIENNWKYDQWLIISLHSHIASSRSNRAHEMSLRTGKSRGPYLNKYFFSLVQSNHILKLKARNTPPKIMAGFTIIENMYWNFVSLNNIGSRLPSLHSHFLLFEMISILNGNRLSLPLRSLELFADWQNTYGEITKKLQTYVQE